MLKPVQASEIPREQAIFTEAWNIIKTFHNIEQNGCDEAWAEAIDRSNRLYEAGKGSQHTEELGKAIASAVLNYLETISKNRE